MVDKNGHSFTINETCLDNAIDPSFVVHRTFTSLSIVFTGFFIAKTETILAIYETEKKAKQQNLNCIGEQSRLQSSTTWIVRVRCGFIL